MSNIFKKVFTAGNIPKVLSCVGVLVGVVIILSITPLSRRYNYNQYKGIVGTNAISYSDYADKLHLYDASLLLNDNYNDEVRLHVFLDMISNQLEFPSRGTKFFTVENMISHINSLNDCYFYTVKPEVSGDITKYTVYRSSYKNPSKTSTEAESFVIRYVDSSESDFLKSIDTDYKNAVKSIKTEDDLYNLIDELESKYPLLSVMYKVNGTTSKIAEISAYIPYTDIEYPVQYIDLQDSE